MSLLLKGAIQFGGTKESPISDSLAPRLLGRMMWDAVGILLVLSLFLFVDLPALRMSHPNSAILSETVTFLSPAIQWTIFLYLIANLLLILVIKARVCHLSFWHANNLNRWLIGGLLLAAFASSNCSTASNSTQALILLAALFLGQAAGLWFIWRKDGLGFDRIPLFVSAFGVVLSAAALCQTGLLRTFEYHGKTRATGPWDNPNIFGLLMGTGLVLMVGIIISTLNVRFSEQRAKGWRIPGFAIPRLDSSTQRYPILPLPKGEISPNLLSREPQNRPQVSGPLASPKGGEGWGEEAVFSISPLQVHAEDPPGLHPILPEILRCTFVMFCLCSAFLMGNGLLKSYSRGAWVALFCGLSYLVVKGFSCDVFGLNRFLRRNILPLALVTISLCVVAFWQFGHAKETTTRRVTSIGNKNDFSSRNRIAAWKGALQITGEYPLFGAGWNQLEPLYEHYYCAPKLIETAAIKMNDHLMLGATLGIPALFCFGFYVFQSLSEKEKRGDPTTTAHGQDWLKTTCRAAAIVLLVGFWFDGGLFKLPTAATFWILLELGRGE